MGTTNTIPHHQLAILVAVRETRVIGGSTAVVVSVVGEIDQLPASLWQDVLSRVVSREPRRLIIDLSGILFLSAAGLSVLINVRNAAAQQGIVLQLKAPHRRVVARALEITGLDRLFEIVPPVTAKDEPWMHQALAKETATVQGVRSRRGPRRKPNKTSMRICCRFSAATRH